MVTFAIKTTDDKRVAAWMAKVDERLKSPDWVRKPFSGRVKKVLPGLFIFEVTPLYPRFVMNAMLVSMLAGALALSYYGFGFATYLYGVAALSFIVINLFWSPFFYQAVVWMQTKKLTGRGHKVDRADEEVLRAVLDGKI